MPSTDTATITFVERHEPALSSGTYTVSVTHTLASSAAVLDHHPIYEVYGNERRIAVAGPRFTLPPAQISGLFPPDRSQAAYPDALPHAALSRLTLPWERSAGSDGLPWLAVLVIDDDEGVAAADAQVGDLGRAPFAPDPASPHTTRASTLPATTASYCDGTGGLTLEHGQAWADRCRIIDVPVDLFAALAPTAADLRWLAHTRTVEGAGEAACSLVVANRTPAVSAKATAHLVSLEGIGAWLPTGAGTPAQAAPATIKTRSGAVASAVRLVALASWTFSAASEDETFAGQLATIPCGVLGLPSLPAATGAAEQVAARAIELGYCAAAHRTRAGDETISWYRGPLIPCPPEAEIVPRPDPSAASPHEPVSAADELLRYDPGTGMLDISYAAAWQLGRLLAVQSSRFSTRLRAWKASVGQQTALAAELELLHESIGAALDPGADVHAAHSAAARLLTGRVKAALRAPATRPPATAAPVPHLPPHASLFARVSAAVADPARLAEQHANTDIPDDVAAWLNGLARLDGVPIGYLVPDERALPSPSMRLFRVDPNWTAALVEGAFSIARASSAQAAHDAAVSGRVAAAGEPAASGFLLRSTVVDDWPDVRAVAVDGAGDPLDVEVRRLGPGLLLGLADGVLAHVDVLEAPGTLHLDIGRPIPRYVTVPAGVKARAGDEIGETPVAVPMRAGPHARVVDVAGLADALSVAVGDAGANAGRVFTAAELALQLTQGAQAVRFEVRP
jgi:hypothetical protein